MRGDIAPYFFRTPLYIASTLRPLLQGYEKEGESTCKVRQKFAPIYNFLNTPLFPTQLNLSGVRQLPLKIAKNEKHFFGDS